MKHNSKPWTEQEISQLKKFKGENASHAEIANALGRTVRAVYKKIEMLGGCGRRTNPTLSPGENYWRDEARKLRAQLEKANRGRTAIDLLLDEVRDLAPKSYETAPAVPWVSRVKSKSSPQSAVLLLSDTHIGAVIRPSQTLGFGEYNFPTFLRRLKRLEKSVTSILQDHTTTKIEELVIPILGDTIDGALIHSAEVGQMNTLFNQFYGAGHALAQFLRNLSALVPKIRVYTCVGNHPRWANQKKMPTKNRFSNLDHFTHAYLQALVRDIPKIDFTLNEQPLAEFRVQGYNFLAGHGDTLRGGDKALGIPAHAIGRAVSATAQLRAKTGRVPVNYYCYGHFHRSMELPHSLGEILINGGFPGIDEFGMAENFSAVPPVQKMFFMHPTFGRSACYDLNLSFAKKEGIPYEIPGEFPMI